MICNKICYKKFVTKNSQQNNSEAVTNDNDKEISKKR